MLRTHSCGELRAEDEGKQVTICGWVESQRIQGKLSFVLLRDSAGIVQIFLNTEITKQL
jgi:aspartyl-tRNA synthetase